MKLNAGTNLTVDILDAMCRWFPARRDDFNKLAEKARLGLQVEVTPIRQRHTTSQRGAYWACLNVLGRELGYSARETEDYLHPVICAETWGVKDHRTIQCRGEQYSWPVPAETSSKDADGKVRDALTYGALIDTLLRFGAEYGVVLEIRS